MSYRYYKLVTARLSRVVEVPTELVKKYIN